MSENIILHHYENSPYAEKIRLMFGLGNMEWKSLLSPARPPRPNVDPLTGGYRRIPVAQMGADIFCDTSLIAEEIALLAGNPQLDPANMSAGEIELMKHAEQKAFFAAVAAVPKLRLLVTMWQKLGPLEIVPFIKDRVGMLKGGTQKPIEPEQAQQVIASLLDDLEMKLSDSQWLAGDSPTVVDFSVYHPLWLYVNFNRKPLSAGENVMRWYKDVSKIGQGQREDVTQAYAFQMAKVSSPRPLPDAALYDTNETPPLESLVKVEPEDYGLVPVTGKLVAITDKRVIIERNTEAFGVLNVHFPRAGYSVRHQGT